MNAKPMTIDNETVSPAFVSVFIALPSGNPFKQTALITHLLHCTAYSKRPVSYPTHSPFKHRCFHFGGYFNAFNGIH